MICIATVATPAAFSSLPSSDAGRVVGLMFARESYVSLALGVLLLLLERRGAASRGAVAGRGSELSFNVVMVLGALFCTVAGHFALQPMMVEARLGLGALSFGQLHLVSMSLFALKIVLVLALSVRCSGFNQPASS